MYSQKIEDFYNRWNMSKEKQDSQEKANEFRRRAINSILIVLEYQIRDGNFNNRFLEIIGDFIIPQFKDLKYSSYYESPIFQKLANEDTFTKFILYLESIFWIKDISETQKQRLCERFTEDIKSSCVNINLFNEGINYLFYPAGAKLLDNKVVNDVLHWVKDYNVVYENFKNALEKYQDKKFDRNVADDMRLSLELLLKKVLNNEKSLENQLNELGKFLESHKITSESKQLCTNILKNYTDYQNNYVKHISKDKAINEFELEFMIYLTGTFMRHIINIAKS